MKVEEYFRKIYENYQKIFKNRVEKNFYFIFSVFCDKYSVNIFYDF